MKARQKFLGMLLGLTAMLFLLGCPPKPIDWGNFNVLQEKAPGPVLPQYNGQPIPYDEYMNWVKWGEEWFRNETFGNERLLTDVTGFLQAPVDIPMAKGGVKRELFFKFFIEALDALDSVAGNLYSGNGGGYTHDLVLTFPPGSKLHENFPLPERLHTGLDVEAGSAWPIGVVPVAAPAQDANLPYLLDPGAYASGDHGVGPAPNANKYRAGMSCAICHYSLDVDWDGKTDLKSARLGEETPGSLFKPQDAWAVGNQDLHLGWVFIAASNPLAAVFASGRPGKLAPADAKAWMEELLEKYESNRREVTSEIVRGVQMMPRGYFDDTPDAIHNPLQYPVLFTRKNWPFNYDGVMLNASDRNNNVWTISFDPSQLVGLCTNRGGKTSKWLFWIEPGIFSAMTAEQYANLLVKYSPAVEHDPAQHDKLRDDILGVSDGMPGVLPNDGIVLIDDIPDVVPKAILNHPDNKANNRVRKASEFGSDGKYRSQMTGMLGTRVITPPDIKRDYNVDELVSKYGLNGDEFVSDAVSLMLDWVEPPTNHSALLANARQAGLVEKGYEVFKSAGCVNCHAGPFFTNNKIVSLKQIGTNNARAKGTEPLQTFVAPEYDFATGRAIAKGVGGIIAKLFGSKQKYGYKVVTLRYLWGTAPYLHDGGVAVTLKLEGGPAGDDLQALLKRSEGDKLYGAGQILVYRETNPESYLRANAALSLQALLLQAERAHVLTANQEKIYPVPASAEHVSMYDMNVQGVGHEFWIQDQPGGPIITPLIAFLLALDDEPGK